MTVQRHQKIVTKDRSGQENGFLVPIYNINDKFVDDVIQQIYVTVCNPHMSKGPHLHRKRTGYFTCISGNVKIIMQRGKNEYGVRYTGEDYEYTTVEVEPGTPTLIVNDGDTPAIILNMTFPAWTPDDQDDYPVVEWSYDAKNNVA
jgi:dTDP-4-dehydrorhamnose 3,5-epimerase-like enzyme